MSFSFPVSAIDVALSLLLPLILPPLNYDEDAARSLALHMLAEYNPRTARDLRLATEAIGFSLRSLMILGESVEPGIKTEALDITLKWATSLSRSSHQAQRRLTEFQRAARTSPAPEPDSHPEPNAHPEPAGTQAQPPTCEPADHAEPASAAPAPMPPGEPAAPARTPVAEPETPDLATAEARLASATKLLNLMKAHHKGAPPPHSSAAQQIQAQQRVVETARLKLEQARRLQTQSAQANQAAI